MKCFVQYYKMNILYLAKGYCLRLWIKIVWSRQSRVEYSGIKSFSKAIQTQRICSINNKYSALICPIGKSNWPYKFYFYAILLAYFFRCPVPRVESGGATNLICSESSPTVLNAATNKLVTSPLFIVIGTTKNKELTLLCLFYSSFCIMKPIWKALKSFTDSDGNINLLEDFQSS